MTLKHWVDRFQPSESMILGGAALLVGLTSGAGVWLFKRVIDLAHLAAFNGLGSGLSLLGKGFVVLVPVFGGLVVGLIVQFLIGEERHHGVAGVMEAVALAGGRLRYKRIPAKAIAAALSIGVGASVGPEDPSVQIGSNLGSMIGQWLHLSDNRVRALVAAGAASGIAAAFNAPIAGVFFALEIILGEISGGELGVVVLASVMSAVFTQAVSGREPAFHVPSYEFGSPMELPLYLVLGLLAGPAAALYVRFIYVLQDIFHSLTRIPGWIKPAIGGLIIGIAGLYYPQFMGVGYDTIGKALNGVSMGVGLLLILFLLKLIMTPVSIGSGFPGGVFAPSLFIGAMLGGAFGWIVDAIFPGMSIVPPAFAMVGMAAVLAGTVHAPLTAIILLFEMTNDYRIILPLMFAVVVGMLISQRLQPLSVYALGLARKGIRLERGRDLEVLETISVSDVMRSAPITLRESDTITAAADLLAHTRHHGAPVLNDKNRLVGVLTLQDIDRLPSDEWSLHSVKEICTRELLVTYPEESIGAALRRMGTRDVGHLPVVDREQPDLLLGWLRRSDLIRSYDVALTRRAALRHHAQRVRLSAARDDDVNVSEVVIEPGAACVGKRMKEVDWPAGCLIASLRRGRLLVIPRGDTTLMAGDVLLVVAEAKNSDQVRKMCKTNLEAR